MDMQQLVETINKNTDERWWEIHGYHDTYNHWMPCDRERTITKAEFDEEKKRLLLSADYGLRIVDARDFEVFECQEIGTGDSMVIGRITVKGSERDGAGNKIGRIRAKLVIVNRMAEDEHLLRRTGYYAFLRQRRGNGFALGERELSWLRAAWLGGAKSK